MVTQLLNKTLEDQTPEPAPAASFTMPDPPEPAESEPMDLWRFHLGLQPGGEQGVLQPAALATLINRERLFEHYPLIWLDERGDALSLTALLEEVADGVKEPTPILDQHRQAFCALARETAAETGDLEKALERTCRSFPDHMDLSEAADTALKMELNALWDALPKKGRILGADDKTFFTLYGHAFTQARKPVLDRFRAETTELVERLEQRLRLEREHSSEGHSPRGVSASLGTVGDSFIDPARLAAAIPAPSGSTLLSPERRTRIEASYRALTAYVKWMDQAPAYYIYGADDLPETPGGTVIWSRSPLETAAGHFDQMALQLARAVCAAQVARLELDDHYNSQIHDALFANPTAQMLSAEELKVLPGMAVTAFAHHLREGMDRFTAQLASGRPLHLLIRETKEPAETSPVHQDPAYLAATFRDLVVVRSSLARPLHLLEGFKRMVRGSHCGLALVDAAQDTDQISAQVLMESALYGRMAPLSIYDPSKGAGWADRFTLTGNPCPDQNWPLVTVGYASKDITQAMAVPFTFLDAAALRANWRSHFQIIPLEAWRDNQVPVSEYLNAQDSSRLLPFLWVVDEEGQLQRAVVDSALVRICADRKHLWNTFQELAGIHNAHATRAAEKARDDSQKESQAAIRRLEEEHARVLESVRNQAGRETMEQLARVLLDLDQGAVSFKAAPSPPSPKKAEPETLPEPESSEEPVGVVEEDEDEVFSEDPYIDTPLCTSCNECLQINELMFKYNEDKQAYVADAAAGTFAQLVQAAEKCPARIIHPGAPRSDDATATADMLEKAVGFNG